MNQIEEVLSLNLGRLFDTFFPPPNKKIIKAAFSFQFPLHPLFIGILAESTHKSSLSAFSFSKVRQNQ
mgnify:CR=1 FL=1